MRYLGLDVGSRQIGVAVGEIIASELTTLRCSKETIFYAPAGIKVAVSELAKLVKDEGVSVLVVGLPVDEDGSPTEESAKITDFCDQLKKELKVDICFTNETLTTFMAAEMLEEQGLDSEEIAQREHQLAAQLILQQYLEDHENKTN